MAEQSGEWPAAFKRSEDFIDFATSSLGLESGRDIAFELIDRDKSVAYEEGSGSRVAAEFVYMGRNSYGNSTAFISNNVIIGRYCSIGPYAGIGLAQHETGWLTTGHVDSLRPMERRRPGWTVLQNDVWVGYGAVVLGGRNIVVGHGACIGANAVVTRSVPPYAVVAGNPARLIRFRFPNAIIAALLQTCWWTLSAAAIAVLPMDDIERCVEELREIRDR